VWTDHVGGGRFGPGAQFYDLVLQAAFGYHNTLFRAVFQQELVTFCCVCSCCGLPLGFRSGFALGNESFTDGGSFLRGQRRRLAVVDRGDGFEQRSEIYIRSLLLERCADIHADDIAQLLGLGFRLGRPRNAA
jgi:hypothetical protein